MFTLPSVWNLVISTFAFIISAWYIRRYLDESGIGRGLTRGIMVFVLAYFVSWGVGEAVDWTEGKIAGPKVTAEQVKHATLQGRDIA